MTKWQIKLSRMYKIVSLFSRQKATSNNLQRLNHPILELDAYAVAQHPLTSQAETWK
jgi:hypothetical protein